jgi:hypothetical protein
VSSYPFELAVLEEIFDFYRDRGVHLDQLRTGGGRFGCNKFLFTRHGFRFGYRPVMIAFPSA